MLPLDFRHPVTLQMQQDWIVWVTFVQFAIVSLWIQAFLQVYLTVYLQTMLCCCGSLFQLTGQTCQQIIMNRSDPVVVLTAPRVSAVSVFRQKRIPTGTWKLISTLLLSISVVWASLEVSSVEELAVQEINATTSSDYLVLWKAFTATQKAKLTMLSSEGRRDEAAANIYLDMGRQFPCRYITLQHYARVVDMFANVECVYFAVSGRRVHLHELHCLPSDTTVRVLFHPLKGGGAKEQQTKHTFASLRGRSCQEVRGIAASFGIKKAGGHRGSRETYKKDELIQLILNFQAASLSSSSSSSGPSLLTIFAAQRQQQSEASLPATLSSDAVQELAIGTLSKPVSRHKRHYAKTRQQKAQKRRDAAKKFYLKKGRSVKLVRYAAGGRSAAREKYQQQRDKLREAARRFHWQIGFKITMAKYLQGGKEIARQKYEAQGKYLARWKYECGGRDAARQNYEEGGRDVARQKYVEGGEVETLLDRNTKEELEKLLGCSI